MKYSSWKSLERLTNTIQHNLLTELCQDKQTIPMVINCLATTEKLRDDLGN
ncbi:hypothetical protein EMIT091MI3_10480 [Kosakonia quasisacchari]